MRQITARLRLHEFEVRFAIGPHFDGSSTAKAGDPADPVGSGCFFPRAWPRAGPNRIPGACALRKLGLIGGMSRVSTRTYYEHINRIVQARTSRLVSAPLLIESLDFTDLARLSTPGEW